MSISLKNELLDLQRRVAELELKLHTAKKAARPKAKATSAKRNTASKD